MRPRAVDNALKWETDSAINSGDSGGPLVNDRCAMVGFAHGGNVAAKSFSYSIEVSEVRKLLERYYQSVGDRHVPPQDAAIVGTNKNY